MRLAVARCGLHGGPAVCSLRLLAAEDKGPA